MGAGRETEAVDGFEGAGAGGGDSGTAGGGGDSARKTGTSPESRGWDRTATKPARQAA
jgi:hypothetical protein